MKNNLRKKSMRLAQNKTIPCLASRHSLFKLLSGVLIFGLLSAALLTANAAAARTYTPKQLRTMIKSGQYPAQGELDRDETTQMTWELCLAKTEAILDAVRPNYPIKKIVDTKIMVTSKVWTNDAAVTVTCLSDGRLHLTSSPYK